MSTALRVMRRDQQHHKMSKRHGDPSYEDLHDHGLSVSGCDELCGPFGLEPQRARLREQEFFTMDELCKAFDIEGISKSPSAFDLEKLNYFNSTYLKELTPEEFSVAAQPWIDKAIAQENVDKTQIAPLLQTRLDRLDQIPEMIAFLNELPEYDIALYTNKKNKLTAESSKELLQKETDALTALTEWSYDSIHDALYALAEADGIKIGKVMWPLRIAAAGKSVTPGGAIEIALILGRDETLRRLNLGLSKLEAQA